MRSVSYCTSVSSVTLQRLRDELGSEPPEEFTHLAEAQLATLVMLVRRAREREAAELRRALDQGLSFVPRLARPALLRVLTLR